MHLTFSNAILEDSALSEIETCRHLAKTELISKEIWEFIGDENNFNFLKLHRNAVELNDFWLNIEQNRTKKLLAKKEMYRQMRELDINVIGDKKEGSHDDTI